MTVPALWSALPGNARGAAWIILAGVCFATMGATVKLLGALGRSDSGYIGCLFHWRC